MPTNIRPIFSGIAPRPIQRPISPVNRFDRQFQLPTTYVDGVLEGGASLGTAYLGSLRLLEDNRIWFKRIAGNSAGSIFAAMIAAGYTANEIEWLCSAYQNAPRRPTGVHRSLNPIDFLDFLDFPSLNTVGNPARRKTLLWKAVKGQVLDIILNTIIPIPTRNSAENDIVAGLKSVPGVGLGVNAAETLVRNAIRPVLSFLPTSQPKLKDFQLFNTENLRIAFADAIWSAVASVDPTLLMSTQLLHEGSLFEGRVFLDTIGRVLGAKIHNNPTADVLFSQLPIPLAVIGANIKTGLMEVYSVQTHPSMVVAEAIRRSMSLPVIFEPIGDLVVDGGLCSNFPAWLFTSAGDSYWPPASIDTKRAKIGFTLDETAAPPRSWGASPGKFTAPIDLKDVLIPQLIAKLRFQGLYTPSASLPEVKLALELSDLKLLEVAVGSAKINQEETVRHVMLEALFANQRFFHVNIPLRGFHGFDFAINGDKADLEDIAERGWFAARDGLAINPQSGGALITNPASLRNPY